MKHCLPLLIGLLLWQGVSAQSVQVAQGLSISVAFPKKLRINVSYDLHLRSHIGVFDEFALTPLADLKVALFRNHMGASLLKKYRAPLYANVSLSYGGLLSYDERAEGVEGIVPALPWTQWTGQSTCWRPPSSMISPGRRPTWLAAKEPCSAGCQSWVATTSSKAGWRRLATGTTASPSATARAPPGMKSFWRSTRISARIGSSRSLS